MPSICIVRNSKHVRLVLTKCSPLVPQLVNHLLRESCECRLMTSHVACTSETSRVFTVSSLQQLKLEALIPAHADFEVRWLIKVLKNKRHGMLSAGVALLHDKAWPHMARRSYIFYRSSAGRCVIIHPISRTSRPVTSIFSYVSRNFCSVSISVFRMTERRR